MKSVVLIVDDVDATRTGLAELLQLLGYETAEAKDGDEALRRLRGNPCTAVVVLDLLMPGANGYWFREQQLNDPAIADTPVIVFTGSETSDALTQTLKVTEVLHKPVSAETLCAAVARYCPSSRDVA
jgi:CheY-like chemotaxis protein